MLIARNQQIAKGNDKLEEPLYKVEKVNAFLKYHPETVDHPFEVNLNISSKSLHQHEKTSIDVKMMMRYKKTTDDTEATMVKWINQPRLW
ncbi:hypothetical protein A0J61_01667 [Choanephora cucurbitarum]|uniref:Uncharacterized protein n=1 Tax=Choanephora cucurbitarum TaxID=101091 RepID=A0A1C7NMB4_9FUNG|nr:hypothetical protein A0J61_01667 [Choanephora cucurbitarum]